MDIVHDHSWFDINRFLEYIMFCSMSESFYNGLDASAIEIAMMFVIVVCIRISSLVLVWSLSGCRSSKLESKERDSATGKNTKCKDVCMKFNIHDRIAILFCCSHKTAVFGIPMLTSSYEDNPNVGVYLLPLLMYPPIQLISGSLLHQPNYTVLALFALLTQEGTPLRHCLWR